MGRTPCCEKVGLKRGRWTTEEDEILVKYIQANGEGGWRSVPRNAGLRRYGKSCRLRWINYLRPDLKRGNITPQEEEIIIDLHASLGSRWSLIAGHLPGRTDNEIKNYWNSHLNKKFHGFITNKNFETRVSARDDCSHGGYKKDRSVMKKKETSCVHKSFLEHVGRAKSMQSITEQMETIQGGLIGIDSSKVMHCNMSVPKRNGFKGKTSEALCSNEESIGSVMLCPEQQDTWEGLEHGSTRLDELLAQNDNTKIPESNGSSVIGGWRYASVGNGKEFYTGEPAPVYDEWVDHWPCIDNQKTLESDDDGILSWSWNDSNEI